MTYTLINTNNRKKRINFVFQFRLITYGDGELQNISLKIVRFDLFA